MLTKVKLSDTTLSTGADGMPMVDAINTSFAFSEEFNFRACGQKIGEKCYGVTVARHATGNTHFLNKLLFIFLYHYVNMHYYE